MPFFLRCTFAAALLLAASSAAADASAPSGCILVSHEGIDDADAHTAQELLCRELLEHDPRGGPHEVRLGKLGGKVLVAVARRQGDILDERRTMVSDLEEIEVAGPRLVRALVEQRPLEETRTVDNVLASEARAPRVENGAITVDAGLFVLTTANRATPPSGGFELAVGYRTRRFGVFGVGQAGGIGSADRKLTATSIGIGGRYYVGDGDTAAFVGGGFAASFLNRNDESGSGVGAFGNVGVETLRSHRVRLVAAVRVDVPFFVLDGPAASYPGDVSGGSRYLIPVSAGLSLVFH